MDLEAWHLAQEMGKAVRGMETIAEQLETLESIPIPRILNFFRQCRRWNGYLKRNERAYLRGDLERMMGTSIEFPTRTERVINRRDADLPGTDEALSGRRAVVRYWWGRRTSARPATHASSGGLHGQEEPMIGPDLLARVTAEAVTPEQLAALRACRFGGRAAADRKLRGFCIRG